MSTRRQLFQQHLAPTSPLPPALDISHADGIYLYDHTGKKYIDLISGIAVSALGHGNAEIKNAIHRQLEKHMHLMVYGEFIISPQVELAKMLADLLPPSLSSVYFTNSGAEATEGAMKLAKRFTGRTGFISFRNAYHGSTQGALSICGNESLKNSFRPLLNGITLLDFNNESHLELIGKNTAAVFAEPVQAEAGVILPEKNFLKKIEERCRQNGALFVLDEIQTGMGRTGSMFAFEQHDIVPDVLLLGKALGGGMPLGAFISSAEIMSSLSSQPVLGHLTTFGGHPVCCAASAAAISQIVEKNLASSALEKEKLFRKHLSHESFREIRGKGLLLAIEFESEKFNHAVISRCSDKGLITDWFLFAAGCLRIAPPLVISDEEIINSCNIINESAGETAGS